MKFALDTRRQLKRLNVTDLQISALEKKMPLVNAFAATLLAPAITLLLHLTGKMGIAAYCASRPKTETKK